MVLYGLTVIVLDTTSSKAAVSWLILTFLVPAVLLSAIAGVYVDRFDPRIVLVATNVLRGIAIAAMVFAGDQLALVYLLNIIVSTASTFFSPAEATMIPRVVPRHQLVAANGIFTVTLNAAFALGFALFGSLAVTIAGPQGLLLIVAALYLVAAVFCYTLPSAEERSPGCRRSRRPPTPSAPCRPPSDNCAKASATSASTARSRGASSISERRPRSSACSGRSDRVSRSRPWGSRRRTSSSSSCRSASAW